jgi:hypothetical protein
MSSCSFSFRFTLKKRPQTLSSDLSFILHNVSEGVTTSQDPAEKRVRGASWQAPPRSTNVNKQTHMRNENTELAGI